MNARAPRVARAATAVVLAASLLLAACGQKGPLYLPDGKKKTSVPAAPAPATPSSAAPASAPTSAPAR
jgi:predicted small lipoprotein YifL